MPKWAKVVLRTVGIVNSAALLLGTSFLVDSAYRVLTGRVTVPNDAPYFMSAFAVMTLIELAFVIVFLITAIRFVRARLSAAHLYSLAVALHIIYRAATGMLWRMGPGIGASIAAATAASSAITLFEVLFLVPFLYPVASMILVQLLRWRYNSRQILAGA